MSQNFSQRGDIIDAVGTETICPALNNKPTAGDVVVVGARLAGVAEGTSALTTDPVEINTRGVFNVPVFANNGAGSAVVRGDALFVSITTAVVSKIAGGLPFGIALGPIPSGNTQVIPVRLGIV